MNETLYNRWTVESVKDALSIWRSVFIAGVHQCGKTTLTRQLEVDGEIRSLDDSALLDIANEDPAGFVKRPSGTTSQGRGNSSGLYCTRARTHFPSGNSSMQSRWAPSAHRNASPSHP